MEVLGHLRSSFRSYRHSAASASHSASGDKFSTSTDSNNNSEALSRKRASNCDLCGKRLLKLVKWRNYFVLPCKCRHVFCKQCITGRLQCRQKVLHAASFDLMWTFPCPGSSQCGQELTVDWSRGSSYSRNLVARDLGSADNSWEEEEEEEEESCGDLHDNLCDVSDLSSDVSVLREIG